jgi:hypothetical protein
VDPVSAFSDVRGEWAGKLAAAGALGVTLDPTALPPFTLVDLVTVTGASGVGGWAAQLPVRVVVAPPGDANAAAQLEDGLQIVLTTLGAAPAFPGTVTAAGGKDCPAYTVTYPVDVPNPNC